MIVKLYKLSELCSQYLTEKCIVTVSGHRVALNGEMYTEI